MDERTYYPDVHYLSRASYASRRVYLAAYRDFCRHYDFKARVEGGWVFFTYRTDLDVWRSQK